MAATAQRVLLVDDNADSSGRRPAAADLRSRRGFTGRRRSHCPADDSTGSVVPTRLPRMDGYEVARRLRVARMPIPSWRTGCQAKTCARKPRKPGLITTKMVNWRSSNGSSKAPSDEHVAGLSALRLHVTRGK